MAKYKFNHYVPATYLRSWNDDTVKIWVYKEQKFYRHGKAEKLLGSDDLYVKKN